MQRAVRSSVAILMTLALAACGGAATPTVAPAAGSSGPSAAVPCVKASTAGTVQAKIKDFAFTPEPIQAKVGDTVTWTNGDTIGHSAALDDGSCATDTINGAATGSLTFSAPGTYPYHCAIHPTRMKGTIVVTG